VGQGALVYRIRAGLTLLWSLASRLTGETVGQPLEVDIVSDVVCPWCIIGYKQLMKALAALPGQFDATIRWHPFELNPRMPQEGQDLREHLAQKYGASPEQSQAARARLSELGDSLGFTVDYFEGMRMVNTFRAHQLLHWALEQGRQTELKLALFEAFFSRREDVNDAAVLVAAAERADLDSAQANVVLSDARYASVVRQEQQQWLDREVHAVPTFVFQQQYIVPGAQDAEAFMRLLQKLQARGDRLAT
jgi:predicted DsbA family dithiol-disulfide isomerase